jgi:DNA mismatch repair protein MutL
MDSIRLLPDSVANQIAAGEVIQRPASVIKELVENAVDAGAKNIQVLVVDAGRTCIQVIDDGCGMSETDARLAFERHATSKIREADDLFALQTMGFRGEALPSIVAVAQVELLTRTVSEDIGTHVTVVGSKIVGQEPVACPVGSNFKVENLFFNVPARRKFLKANSTELTHILAAYERIVLAYPDINFTFLSNSTELLNLRAGTLRQRIADVFGLRFNQDLLPMEADTSLCRISGFVGKPESARKKGAHQYFFVNGRFMRHPYFHKAVCNAYERLVPEGQQVSYFIYLEVSPADIDVNIHPTKTEIKFENEQAIWQILTAAVKDAIGKFCEIPTINFDTEGRPDIPVFDPASDHVQSPRINYNPDYNPFKSGVAAPVFPSASSGGSKKGLEDWQELYQGLRNEPIAPFVDTDLFSLPQTKYSRTEELLADKSPTHYQYKGRYIMTAVKSGLMIIDQHRADIRLLYERYLQLLSSHSANTQKLLFPEVVQFAPSESVVLQRIMPELAAVGFDLSDLGGNNFAVNGVPAGIEGIAPVILLQRMVADAAEKGEGVSDETHAVVALSLARAAAIPYGQVLSNEEMENVVNQLFTCSNVNYTPDGRSILSILPQSDIEHLLG